MSLLLILAAVLIGLIEGRPLFKKGMWRELAALTFLIGAGLFFLVTKKLGLPTPVEWLQQLVGPIGEAVYKKP